MTNPQVVFKVERAIPLVADDHGRGRCTKYPFDRMQVGDSFVIRDYRTRWAAHRAAHAYMRRHRPIRFAIRRQVNVWRCWRTQ